MLSWCYQTFPSTVISYKVHVFPSRSRVAKNMRVEDSTDVTATLAFLGVVVFWG